MPSKTPSAVKKCAVVVVGGAGLVGRVLVRRWQARLDMLASPPQLVCLDLHENPDAAVNLTADLRDPSTIERRLFARYHVQKMIIAVKPPLIGPSYQSFIEVNMAGIVELMKLAEAYKVKSVVYVSSLAACSHWVPHSNLVESDPASNPPLTSLRSPYDLSKAMAEQYILQKHSLSGMHTVSIRIAGVYAHDYDNYWNRRLPMNLSLEIADHPSAPQIDSNYVENVAEGLLRVSEKLSKDPSVGGRFYFYTIGDRRVRQQALSKMLAHRGGRLHISVPPRFISYYLRLMTVLASLALQLPSWPFFQPAGRAVNPKPYFTTYSMNMCALIDQTFDNSLFIKTFGYSHLYTTEEAVEAIVKAALHSVHERRNYKAPSVLDLVFGFVFLLIFGLLFTALVVVFSSCSVACTSPLICSAANAGVAFSTPATHVFGVATQPKYKLWQPFRGGRLHVYLQGIGWFLFSLMCLQWCMSWFASHLLAAPLFQVMTAEQIAMLTDDRIKAVLGFASQMLLTCSLFAFQEGKRDTPTLRNKAD